jgi:hypothetical protein
VRLQESVGTNPCLPLRRPRFFTNSHCRKFALKYSYPRRCKSQFAPAAAFPAPSALACSKKPLSLPFRRPRFLPRGKQTREIPLLYLAFFRIPLPPLQLHYFTTLRLVHFSSCNIVSYFQTPPGLSNKNPKCPTTSNTPSRQLTEPNSSISPLLVESTRNLSPPASPRFVRYPILHGMRDGTTSQWQTSTMEICWSLPCRRRGFLLRKRLSTIISLPATYQPRTICRMSPTSGILDLAFPRTIPCYSEGAHRQSLTITFVLILSRTPLWTPSTGTRTTSRFKAAAGWTGRCLWKATNLSEFFFLEPR